MGRFTHNRRSSLSPELLSRLECGGVGRRPCFQGNDITKTNGQQKAVEPSHPALLGVALLGREWIPRGRSGDPERDNSFHLEYVNARLPINISMRSNLPDNTTIFDCAHFANRLRQVLRYTNLRGDIYRVCEYVGFTLYIVGINSMNKVTASSSYSWCSLLGVDSCPPFYNEENSLRLPHKTNK